MRTQRPSSDLATRDPSTPTAYDPWSDLERSLLHLRDRFFTTFGLAPWPPPAGPESGRWTPARADVTETGSAYRIVVDVPGIPMDRLEVRARGSSVEIRGGSVAEKETNSSGILRKERRAEGCYRTLELPTPVCGDPAEGRLENGVLELELPKETPTPPAGGVKIPVAQRTWGRRSSAGAAISRSPLRGT